MRPRDLAIMATLTAVLTVSKTALAFIPNVEIATSLLVVYALALGRRRSLLVCVAFVLIECIIWGVGYWVVLYLIYWPLLVLTVSFLPRNNAKTPLAIVIGFLFTIGFGGLSTLIEICMMGAIGSPYFGQYFYLRYLSGINFFVTHIISNAVILPVLVPILYPILSRLTEKKGKTLRG